MATRLRSCEAREAVLIDTCHRVELVSVDADPSTFRAQHQHGPAAIRRVFEVVAGFDSAVVAEEQLLGQIRSAYDHALASGRSGPILNELMRRALRFGRRVRSFARPGSDRSLADVAAAWLGARTPPGGRVLVIGTGEIGRLMAIALDRADHPITVVSRSTERGGRVLRALRGGQHRLVTGAPSATLLQSVPAVALAIRSTGPVLTATMLPRNEAPWVVDLSSPSVVDAAARDRLGERLADLDAIGSQHPVRPVLEPRAEVRLRRELDAEVDAFADWFRTRASADALAVLRREAEAIRRKHLERLRRRAELDDTQLAAVDASSAAMVNELLHAPTVELRHGGADAAAVRRLFRIGG